DPSDPFIGAGADLRNANPRHGPGGRVRHPDAPGSDRDSTRLAPDENAALYPAVGGVDTKNLAKVVHGDPGRRAGEGNALGPSAADLQLRRGTRSRVDSPEELGAVVRHPDRPW